MNRIDFGRGYARAVLVSCAVAALSAAPALAEHPGMPEAGAAAASLHRSPVDATIEQARAAGGPLFVGAESMRRIQHALNEAGFDAGSVDGVYGRRTGAALCGFQKTHGLEPSGGVTLATMQKLGVAAEPLRGSNDATGEADAANAVPVMIGRATIRKVQQAMADAGHGWKGVDGMWTTTFSHALRRWQAAEGLEPTGTITLATLAAVGRPDHGAGPELASDENGGSTMAEEDLLAEAVAAAGPDATATDATVEDEEPALAADEPDPAKVDCDAASAHNDPYVTQLYLDPSAVRRIERVLGDGGHKPGRPDGVFDTRTSYGLVRFQKAQGIEATGTLTIRTVGELGFTEVLQGTGS